MAKDDFAGKIARAISDCGGKATVKQISELLECPYSTIGRRMRQLADTGERLAEGGRAGAVYQLNPSAHSFPS